jgi:hypothetical protein
MSYEKWDLNKIEEAAKQCKTKQEMKTTFPKAYAAAKRMGILNDPMFDRMPRCSHSPEPYKWTKGKVAEEALKYPDRKKFFLGSRSAYNASKKMKIFEEVCAHMPKHKSIGNHPYNFKWTKEKVAEEALKYNKKTDFRNNSLGAYQAALANEWIKDVCGHMQVLLQSYTTESLMDIFKDCKNKKEAMAKNRNAYVAVKHRKIQSIVFAHMPKRIDKSGRNSPFYKGENEELHLIAKKYNNRITFLTEDAAVYQRAYKRGILDKVCSHMQSSKRGTSVPERNLFDIIKKIYPTTKKIRDMSVKIEGKPYIKGFDIDIFVPELKKGIEFDGKYFHSPERLISRHENWPKEDALNYHELKDFHFASKGIQVLHVKEEDWIEDRESCIKKCFDFLGESNGL